MDRLTTVPLRIGDWRLDTRQGTLTRGEATERLEARSLRLLVYLANRAGETVSIEELLDHVWSGVVVTQDSVYQAITALRRLLGDDARNPRYIVTVPRLGYRLVAPVAPWLDADLEPTLPAAPAVPTASGAPAAPAVPAASQARSRRKSFGVAALGLALLLTIAVGYWLLAREPARRSVAVLPFLDLTTQAMEQEYFADGLTEELIQRLSKLPGFEVPAPTASYYFKGRQVPVAEIADELGVRYLLDGSLREAGDILRISARLVRAEDGFVMWTESYERPVTDRIRIQDEIATEVAKALDASIP